MHCPQVHRCLKHESHLHCLQQSPFRSTKQMLHLPSLDFAHRRWCLQCSAAGCFVTADSTPFYRALWRWACNDFRSVNLGISLRSCHRLVIGRSKTRLLGRTEGELTLASLLHQHPCTFSCEAL